MSPLALTLVGVGVREGEAAAIESARSPPNSGSQWFEPKPPEPERLRTLRVQRARPHVAWVGGR
eukprot:5167393-Pyramimonas_sp.AAC.1